MDSPGPCHLALSCLTHRKPNAPGSPQVEIGFCGAPLSALQRPGTGHFDGCPTGRSSHPGSWGTAHPWNIASSPPAPQAEPWEGGCTVTLHTFTSSLKRHPTCSLPALLPDPLPPAVRHRWNLDVGLPSSYRSGRLGTEGGTLRGVPSSGAGVCRPAPLPTAPPLPSSPPRSDPQISPGRGLAQERSPEME